jgi:hypothetical protein
MLFYISLQFSAIQATINRHDRLWSIAGISRILQEINEVKLKETALKIEESSSILLSGGGKFTVGFSTEENACIFREKALKIISTALPMLEFQISDIFEGANFKEIREHILDQLKNRKKALRGYSVTFNPHLYQCDECGEFPAESFHAENKICRICKNSRDSVYRHTSYGSNKATCSIDAICAKIFERSQDKLQIPYEFEDLFKNREDANESRRIAVWFSDLNSMKDRVSIWNNQDENKILECFDKFKKFVVDWIGDTINSTFESVYNDSERKFFPFRIIVAGGDDLCIVMDEKYILSFTGNLSKIFYKKLNSLNHDHPLSDKWLKEEWEKLFKNNSAKQLAIKPFSFGGSFVITHYKTPFKKIYDFGEELMKQAKQESKRQYNCVNWAVIFGDESEKQFHFEKPLPIVNDDKKEHLNLWSLEDYLSFIKSNRSHLTSSQMNKIVKEISHNNTEELLKIFRQNYCKDTANLYQKIMDEKYFYNFSENMLYPNRILTLFELTQIKGE